MLCIVGFDGSFKRINPAFERVTGYSAAEILAAPFLSFLHPDDRDATIAEGIRLTEGRAMVAVENRYRCKDGRYRWLSWNATPVLADGVIYAVGRDVTE